MFGFDFISKSPEQIQQQLWDRLPGEYQFSRSKHHNMLVSGQKCTQADIEPVSWGRSEIDPRTPTDPAYESELLQRSTFYIVFKNSPEIKVEKIEARIFRLQNGEWSLWNTDGTDRECAVTEKLVDLTLGQETIALFVKLKAVKLPWKDANGLNKWLGLEFCVGEEGDEGYWHLYHRLEDGDGEETVEETEYRKIPEDRREGWSSWLAEAVKVQFVGVLKGFVGV